MFWGRLRTKLLKNWEVKLTAFATVVLAIKALQIRMRLVIIAVIVLGLAVLAIEVFVYLFQRRIAIINTIRKMVAFIAAFVKRYIAILRTTLALMIAIVIMVVLAFPTPKRVMALPIAIAVLLILLSNLLSSIATAIIKALRKSGVIIYISQNYMAILGTITTIMIILIFFTTKRLPTADSIEKVARNVGNDIASTNMASLNSSMDNIINTIINYQRDPEATRNRVYEDALKQAADKGYIFYVPQKNYYITAKNWRGDKRQLTEDERDIIEKALKEIFERSNKRDQISLMNMVLSNIRETEELWKPKDRIADLSPLDLIGVVGGYIGELVLKY